MTAKKRNTAEETSTKKQNQFFEVMKRLSYNKGAMLGLVLFILVVLIAIFAPVLAPYDYAKIDIKNRLLSPCAEHIFGTDQMGRDILSRVKVFPADRCWICYLQRSIWSDRRLYCRVLWRLGG